MISSLLPKAWPKNWRVSSWDEKNTSIKVNVDSMTGETKCASLEFEFWKFVANYELGLFLSRSFSPPSHQKVFKSISIHFWETENSARNLGPENNLRLLPCTMFLNKSTSTIFQRKANRMRLTDLNTAISFYWVFEYWDLQTPKTCNFTFTTCQDYKASYSN